MMTRGIAAAVAAALLAGPGAGSAGARMTAPAGPSVTANYLIDLDHGAAFSKNKQNEQSITRDPVTGALVAGANDEISQPLCAGTTQPSASPCPFEPGAPTSAYYRSTDDGKTWSGGYLPGFGS